MVRVILGRGRSALLRRFLVLALVPVVVFSTPGQASAATTYGDAATAEFGVRESNLGSAVGSTVSCSATGYWQAIETVMNVKGRVTCSTGYNVSSALVGFTANGAGCSGSWDPIEMDGAGTRDFIIPMGAVVGSCQVTELCFSIKAGSHTNPWMDDNDSGCVPWSVGGPEAGPPSGRECDGVTMAVPTISAWQLLPDGTGEYRWARIVTFEITLDASLGDQMVAFYSVQTNSANYPSSAGLNTSKGTRRGRMTRQSVTAGTSFTHVFTQFLSPRSTTGSSAPGADVAAVGYIVGANASWDDMAGYGGQMGVTQQTPYCAAHWGEKLATTADGSDEPAGPLSMADDPPPSTGGTETEPTPDPAPPVSDETCGDFSLTDPSSWAGAGVCAIVKAIQGLISVVAGIPGAILDGLAALFVPDPSVIEAEVEGVKDAWSDSTVGNYVEPFADADLAVPSGGCAGPSVDFSLRGEDVHWEPLNACSGGMASLASLARLFVTVFVGFFGGLACVRAVGSGFGWRPGVAES